MFPQRFPPSQQTVVYIEQVVHDHDNKPVGWTGLSGNRQLHVTVTSVLPHAFAVTHPLSPSYNIHTHTHAHTGSSWQQQDYCICSTHNAIRMTDKDTVKRVESCVGHRSCGWLQSRNQCVHWVWRFVTDSLHLTWGSSSQDKPMKQMPSICFQLHSLLNCTKKLFMKGSPQCTTWGNKPHVTEVISLLHALQGKINLNLWIRFFKLITNVISSSEQYEIISVFPRK